MTSEMHVCCLDLRGPEEGLSQDAPGPTLGPSLVRVCVGLEPRDFKPDASGSNRGHLQDLEPNLFLSVLASW